MVDGKTGEPLDGINVYYCVRSRYVQHFLYFIIPSPDPWGIDKSEEVAALKSDKNGEVVILKHKICIKRPQKLYEEQILINIDVQNRFLESERLDYRVGRLCESLPSSDFHYNPNNKYKGFRIVNFRSKEVVSTWYTGLDREIADSLYVPDGLNKPEEDLVIKLDRRQNTGTDGMGSEGQGDGRP